MWFREDGSMLQSPTRPLAVNRRESRSARSIVDYGDISPKKPLSGSSSPLSRDQYVDVDVEEPRHSQPRPSLKEARRRRKVSRSASGGEVDPLDIYDRFHEGAHHSTRSSLDELFATVPGLASDFHCSDEDATILLALVSAAANHRGSSADIGRLEDKVLTLESEAKMLRQRLERRTEEAEKLKDELEGARGKISAVEQQARQTVALLSQKRDEVRRQLINEESRTAKLQKQNKNLENEIERLKSRLHAAMQR